MGGISSWEEHQQIRKFNKPSLSPALRRGSGFLLFWVDFFLPKALLVPCASVSRYVSPRQWPLSADNGQREECRRRAGLEEGQSAFRIQWPSGCCREGPAVTRAASSKTPFIGPAAPGKWMLWAAGKVDGLSPAHPPRLPADSRYLLYQPLGAPAATAPALQTLFNEKTNSHPQIRPRPAVPALALLQYPAWASIGRLSRKERAYSSPKVETRFLGGKLCNHFVAESTTVLKVFWKKKSR